MSHKKKYPHFIFFYCKRRRRRKQNMGCQARFVLRRGCLQLQVQQPTAFGFWTSDWGLWLATANAMSDSDRAARNTSSSCCRVQNVQERGPYPATPTLRDRESITLIVGGLVFDREPRDQATLISHHHPNCRIFFLGGTRCSLRWTSRWEPRSYGQPY